jgi:hypothetical protein
MLGQLPLLSQRNCVNLAKTHSHRLHVTIVQTLWSEADGSISPMLAGRTTGSNRQSENALLPMHRNRDPTAQRNACGECFFLNDFERGWKNYILKLRAMTESLSAQN